MNRPPDLLPRQRLQVRQHSQAQVLAIVAERLAQPEGQWAPFQPSGWAGAAYRRMAA